MIAARFLDTNVLLYSISRDPAEVGRREIADSLLDADDMSLSSRCCRSSTFRPHA
jgi:predicted nucleic acid-binding protein